MPTLEDGRSAIDQGNLQQARLIFEAILQENPRSEDAWLGLAEVLIETEDKRICYENVLKINKQNRTAKEGLRHLEPQANPLIAALGQPPPVRTEEIEFEESEPTIVSTPIAAPVEADAETPTFMLVAIGLALSIVIFAISGGLLFFLVTSFR